MWRRLGLIIVGSTIGTNIVEKVPVKSPTATRKSAIPVIMRAMRGSSRAVTSFPVGVGQGD